MAEMRPDNNHRQAVNKLLEDVRSNEELRIHLARDPEPVLQKYGLAKLVEQQGVRVTIDIGGGMEGGSVRAWRLRPDWRAAAPAARFGTGSSQSRSSRTAAIASIARGRREAR